MQTLGKYQLIEQLGQGGMGAVYRAHDPIIGRDVAIKVIVRHVVDDPVTRKRFYREAQSAGRLSHPNVTVIHDVGEHDGAPYIVMELLSGVDLREAMQADEMTLAQKLDIMLQVAQGLNYAHRHEIIHRDIKPDNVRVLEGGRVKVMDFGIARFAADESTLTAANKSLGTPKYMAPEQIEGIEIDRRADIFSYGVVLYEFVTGTNPFDAPNVGAIIYRIMQAEPPPLDTSGPGHAQLQEVLDRCLAKDRESRYDNFTEVIRDLQAVLDMVEGRTSVGDTTDTVISFAPATQGRRVAVGAGIGLLVVALAAGGAWWYLQQEGGLAGSEPDGTAMAPTTATLPLPDTAAAPILDVPLESLSLDEMRQEADRLRTTMQVARRAATRAGAASDGAYELADASVAEAEEAYSQGDRAGYEAAQLAYARAAQGFQAALVAAERRSDARTSSQDRAPVAQAQTPPPTSRPPARQPAGERTQQERAAQEPTAQEPTADAGPSISGGLRLQPGETPREETPPPSSARPRSTGSQPSADRATEAAQRAATRVAQPLRQDVRYARAQMLRGDADAAYAQRDYLRAFRYQTLAERLYGAISPQPTSDAALDQALESFVALYQRALQNRERETLEGLFPDFTSADAQVWNQYLDEGGEVNLFTTTADFETGGENASAEVGFQLDYTSPGGQRRRSSMDYLWRFEKIGSGWILTGMRPK